MELYTLIVIINGGVELSTRENILLPCLEDHDLAHYLLDSLNLNANTLLAHI